MLSPEALDLLEFSLGPKSKRGKGDRNADRVGKKLASAAIGAASAPAYSVFGNGTHQQRSANAVAAIKRTVAKTPEVMVKMTGRQNGQAHVAENFSYIARLGWGEDKELELLTSEGKIITNRKEMSELAREWHLHEIGDDARRKGSTSLSFVLSMPPGTDPEKIKATVAEFAKTEMAGRQWVMGLHTDQEHPHVHLTVARRDIDGRRFHPGKEDLFRYRQVFAEKLRDKGIEANATPRKARGVTRKALVTPIVQMAKRGELSRYDRKLHQEAVAAIREGKQGTPYSEFMRQQRVDVLEGYVKAGKELLHSEDPELKKIAHQLAPFANQLPAIETRSELNIRIAQDRIGKAAALTAEQPTKAPPLRPTDTPSKDRSGPDR